MAVRTVPYEKANILQRELDNAYFTCTDTDGLEFDATGIEDSVYAFASNTHYPRETDMPHWNSVNYNWTRSTAVSPSDYKTIISLLGVNSDGGEQLIGEHIIDTIGVEVTETRSFDLRQSAIYPQLTRITGTAPADNIQVTLPYRYLNFENVDAYLCTLYQTGNITAGWTVRAGVRTPNVVVFTDGNHWMQHTGDGNNSPLNLITIANTSTDYIAQFKFVVATAGTYSSFRLFTPRYVDSNNLLSVYTAWNGTDQVLQLIQKVGGNYTTIQEVIWKDTQLTADDTEYDIWITDTGTHMTVKIDDITYIDTDYTTTLAATNKGHGSNVNSSGYWDNIRVMVKVSPTTPDDEDINLYYPVPTGWVSGSPLWLEYNEYDNATYKSGETFVTTQNIVQMGYNSLDAYSALRLRFEIWADLDYVTKINNNRCKQHKATIRINII